MSSSMSYANIEPVSHHCSHHETGHELLDQDFEELSSSSSPLLSSSLLFSSRSSSSSSSSSQIPQIQALASVAAPIIAPVVVGSPTVGSVDANSISLAQTDADESRVGFPVLGIKHTTPVLLRLPSGKLAVIVYGGRPVNGNRWGGAAAATFIHTLLINETFTGITALQQPFQKGVVGMMHRSGAVIAARPQPKGGQC
jgi:hypothetical protein